jgi:hypothetical protein
LFARRPLRVCDPRPALRGIEICGVRDWFRRLLGVRWRSRRTTPPGSGPRETTQLLQLPPGY